MHEQNLTLALALAAAVTAASPLPAPAQEAVTEDRPAIRDERITRAVESRLYLDPAVSSHLIDVTTQDGVVVLSGTADNLLAKERATELTRTIRGVLSVVNHVVVEPVDVSNRRLRSDVSDALLADPATDAYDVRVSAKDGVVTVEGEVQSWAEKQLVRDVVRGVRGVREIVDRVRIEHTEERPDDEIAAEIRRRLAADTWVDAERIEVGVEDGAVTLSGAVGSAAERSRARWDAWVAGVHDVDIDDLEVRWWAGELMHRDSDYVDMSDEEIEKAIRKAFTYDPRVFSFSPDVEVREGLVTLSGTVGNLLAKKAAGQDARNTAGVWRVRNYLRVRESDPPSDAAIAHDVRAALDRNPYLDHEDISVRVRNRKVYLSGSVPSSFARYEAGDVAAAVQGVAAVANELDSTHKGWVTRSDRAIQQDIEENLYWSPYLADDAITVNVVAGVATLSGQVDTWPQRELAADAARRAGAKEVVNRLSVLRGPEHDR